MKKTILTIIATICLSVSLSAQPRPSRVPATPHPIEITQPNGEKLTLRLFGDEHQHFRTTTDGFVIVEDKNGTLCYAKIDKNGNLVPSKKQAHNVGERTKCEEKFLKKQAKKTELKKEITN